MVGMRVFLVDHVQLTQWSWIKSTMSNGSSKVVKLHPSFSLGMYKEKCRPSTLPCPPRTVGRQITASITRLPLSKTIQQNTYVFKFNFHEHEEYMIMSFGCLPARIQPTRSINGLAIILRLVIIKPDNNCCRTGVGRGCWPCDITRCLLFILRALPFGRQGQ